jgi:hypothetical protein
LEAAVGCEEGTNKHKYFQGEVRADECADRQHSEHVEDGEEVVQESVEESEGGLGDGVEHKRPHFYSLKHIQFSVVPWLCAGASVIVIHLVDTEGADVLKERSTLYVFKASLNLLLLFKGFEVSLLAALRVVRDEGEHLVAS